MWAVNGVAEVLAENTSYSLKLDSVPAGQDYAEYFCLDKRKVTASIMQQRQRYYFVTWVCLQDMYPVIGFLRRVFIKGKTESTQRR